MASNVVGWIMDFIRWSNVLCERNAENPRTGVRYGSGRRAVRKSPIVSDERGSFLNVGFLREGRFYDHPTIDLACSHNHSLCGCDGHMRTACGVIAAENRGCNPSVALPNECHVCQLPCRRSLSIVNYSRTRSPEKALSAVRFCPVDRSLGRKSRHFGRGCLIRSCDMRSVEDFGVADR